MKPRWIVGNLDCEIDWARLQAPGSGRWPRSLPLDVLHRVSAYATLLRVLGEEGDTLWTPAPVDPRTVRVVDGLPDLQLAHGPDALPPKGSKIIAWADAPPLDLPRARLEAAAKVNDRAFALRLTERFGVALPGTQVVTSLEEFLATDVAGGAWVLKAPHGAAGRNRVLGSGRRLDEPQRGAIANLLREHGRLILQPWVRRTLDFGLWLAPDGDGGWLRGVNKLEVDERGRFRGVVVTAEGPALDAPAYLHTVGDLVRDHLHGAGYEGAFGIDGYEYQSSIGTRMLMPLGEINARRTFGMVAHALVARVAPRYWGEHAGPVALRFGQRDEREDPTSCVPLLGSADEPIMHAWLERVPLREHVPTADDD
ncbi:MAG: hypothetical protein O2894_08400 [Planctomycetota bacterium]|nr:hypothetical protein [Planctomycetota bacterium]